MSRKHQWELGEYIQHSGDRLISAFFPAVAGQPEDEQDLGGEDWRMGTGAQFVRRYKPRAGQLTGSFNLKTGDAACPCQYNH